MYNFRTDLADERRELYRKANGLKEEIEGIQTEQEEKEGEITVSRVKVLDEKGEQAIGKPKGTYITINIKNLKIAREEEMQQAADILAHELKGLIDKHSLLKDDILVVGLGNRYVTPDSLGPKVINDIEVTRHIIQYMPQYINKEARPVSAISPGVLGTTGIETQEILKGIVENVKPKLLIVIDALASRSMERISTTIQLADTGIIPGAGVDNKRKELSRKTLGIPVIALGVPTVVEAATIAADSLELWIEKMTQIIEQEAEQEQFNNQNKEKLYSLLKGLKEEDNYNMIKEVLLPQDYNYIVTPKEIDDLIQNMSQVVAMGINQSV